jgi:hypothetical protein
MLVTAVTVCIRHNAQLEIVEWASPDEARLALNTLLKGKCCTACKGRHLMVLHDGDTWEVTFPLAEQLAALYGSPHLEPLPVAPGLNPELASIPLNGLRDRVRRGQLLSLQRGLATVGL